MSVRRSRVFTTEVSTPEMELVASQLKYLRHLNERIQKEEIRVTAAHEAIPKLQNLLAQRQEEIKSFSGVIADIMRLQVQPEVPYESDSENSFLLPALSARVEYGRLTRLAAEAKEYRRSLSYSLAIIEEQVGAAQSVISASTGVLARMQGTRSTMLESIKLQYGLIHPIHRLSDDILAYIFSLIVSEKFETVRVFRGDPEDCPEFNSLITLASVCSTWRDIAYDHSSLWHRVVVTDVSPPTPYRRYHAAPPIAVIAVGNALFGNDHARLPSLASRTSIDDLTITSSRLGHIQFDLSRIKSIQRLTIAYSEFQGGPTTFFIPTGLANLSSLTCIHNYPSFHSAIPSIRDFSLSVRASSYQPQFSFGRILRYFPNLDTLSLYWSPVLSFSRRVEHQFLTTIKAHFSAIKSLASSLNHGTLVLPRLARLEISDLGHEKLLEDWSEVFPFDSWPSQVTYLHVGLRTKNPRISEADQLYRLLIPFASITTLSIANEPLLPALLPAGVVPVARNLVRLRVEGCSFDGRVLLDVIRRRNGSEWVTRGEVTRLTMVELWDCPNVPPTTMEELRRIRSG